MTYLVEDADEEVLDLADPDALSRHLTVAPSASHAKRALAQQRSGDSVNLKKRARLTSLSANAFPTTADGKLVIDEDGNKKAAENDGE